MTSSPGDSLNSVGARLNVLLLKAGLAPVSASQAIKFEAYLSLLLRWNESVNLTSIRTEGEILERHFVESIACAQALPLEMETLLDFGSGAGFPGLPIALYRPELTVTLAESQVKKAAFLHEAVRVLGISAKVYSQRAELLRGHFDCVTMRAVDRMLQAVETAVRLVAPGGRLALMTTKSEVPKLEATAGPAYSWGKIIQLPNSDDRVIVLGKRRSSSGG
jgi:16S rRNA (guanine527-N7)-methyltransferase